MGIAVVFVTQSLLRKPKIPSNAGWASQNPIVNVSLRFFNHFGGAP